MAKSVDARTGGFEAAPALPLEWHDARSLTLEGRGWKETPGPYDRLPARAEGRVHELDWRFSQHSAGILARFVTDAPEISVRWHLKSTDFAMGHMPSTGVSGVDLYARTGAGWSWLAATYPGMPLAELNEHRLVLGLGPGPRELCLYFPLYNGVMEVEVGVPVGAMISPAPPRRRAGRPIVFYGTSIPQGGCASRPGMAYPAIIGRRLDVPTINLGFSGSGRCEPGIVDLLAELDAEVMVIDSIVNMEPEIVEERMRALLEVFHRRRPRTPLVLMEEAVHPSCFARQRTLQTPKSATLQKVVEEARGAWAGRLFLVKGDMLLGDDGEATVDGIHPTDLGFQRMADLLTPLLARVLEGVAGQGAGGTRAS